MNEGGLDILKYMESRPEIIWGIALMGAVCVIGLTDYFKCFFEKKRKATRWIVLLISLLVAVILSPLVPAFITTIVILWLLILAIASIAKKTIIDGIPSLISKVMGSLNKDKGEK